MKDRVQCPKCRKEVLNLEYCISCGAKLRRNDLQEGPYLANQSCPKCNKSNPKEYAFCAFCGAQLSLTATKNSQGTFNGFKFSSENINWQKKQNVVIRDIRTTQLPLFSRTLRAGYFSSSTPSMSSKLVLKQQMDMGNLVHYLAAFIIVMAIYAFWYSCWFLFLIPGSPGEPAFGIFDLLLSNATFIPPSNPLFTVLEIFLVASLLFFLSFAPIFLSTFYIMKESQVLVLFRINARLFIFSVLFGLFLPLILPPGVLTLREKDFSIGTKSMEKGIAIAAITQVLVTAGLLITGILGTFLPDSFLNLFKNNILLAYKFSTWIAIFTIIPLVSPYGKLLKQWNPRLFWVLVIICGIFLLFFFIPFELI
ncbi:MAG: zinc ribbon domain-containing protein [Promethearchaeota archaeon]